MANFVGANSKVIEHRMGGEAKSGQKGRSEGKGIWTLRLGRKLAVRGNMLNDIKLFGCNLQSNTANRENDVRDPEFDACWRILVL